MTTYLPLEPVGPNPLAAPRLRWGILAPGGIARLFAKDVHAHTISRVEAVGSRDLERATAFADEFSIPRAYGSYEELLSDENIDAVYIASPHSHHYTHARAAIRARKHVLVEKAFTHNSFEAEAVFYAARDAGVHVMEAMWSRFLPHFYTLRALMARKEIGSVVHLHASHGQPIAHIPRMAQPEMAGGALLDLGVYPISFAHHLMGPPRTLRATSVLTPEGVDKTTSITLGYRTAVATLTTTMAAPLENTATITGTKGTIKLSGNFYHPDSTITVARDGEEPYVMHSPVEGGYQYEAAEMARNIHANVLESPLMTWQNTIDVMALMDEVRAQIGVTFPKERQAP